MKLALVFTCLMASLWGARLDAAQDSSVISGQIELVADPKGGVRVELQIYNPADQPLGSITLHVDSTPNHSFRERFLDKPGKKFVIRVDVDQPQGYVSQWPDYSWSKGQTINLLLKPKSAAYEGWIKSAQRAEGLTLGLKRLDAMVDWNLPPAEGFSITRAKASLYDRWRELRGQQEYLSEIFDSAEVQGLPEELLIEYFKVRIHGYTKLVGGRFNSILQVQKLQDLWEALLSDFVAKYAVCSLDPVMTSTGNALTLEAITQQRKTMRTWLGRPGASVRDCRQPTLVGP